MKVIRFRRFASARWDTAFSEKDLNEKLNGEMAEVIMPAKPLLVRLARKVYPPRAIEAVIGQPTNVLLLSTRGLLFQDFCRPINWLLRKLRLVGNVGLL